MHRRAIQIHKQIEAANHILLVPHQNPDGDALGSVSALIKYFENIYKKTSAYCATPASNRYEFLPHFEKIIDDVTVWNDKTIDLILVLDSGDLHYAGIDEHIAKLEGGNVVVNIDHHLTNENYGHHNLVVPHASSTAEVLFNYFRYNKIDIDKHMATSLLTGIITDTDNFSNSATSVSSLSAASELIKLGGDLNLIKAWVLKDKSVASLKLWGTVLSRLTLNQDLDVAHTYITQKDLREHNVSESEIDGIANFLNNLSDGKAGLILKETEDKKIKGSFRTTRDDVDVSKIAKRFGGGGHQKAAGFTIDGPMDKALNKVLHEMKRKGK